MKSNILPVDRIVDSEECKTECYPLPLQINQKFFHLCPL
jgi:hypothetical protein